MEALEIGEAKLGANHKNVSVTLKELRACVR